MKKIPVVKLLLHFELLFPLQHRCACAIQYAESNKPQKHVHKVHSSTVYCILNQTEHDTPVNTVMIVE